MSKFICLLAVVSVSAACGFFAGQQTKSPANSASSISEDTKKSDFLKIFQSENIQKFQSWEGDNGKKFFGVIRQLNEPCDKDYGLSSCQQFSIYDETGKVSYELKDFRINGSVLNLVVLHCISIEKTFLRLICGILLVFQFYAAV